MRPMLFSLAGLFLIKTLALAADSAPLAAVNSGQLRGALLGAPSDKGGAAFKGIPYAQPPVGDLRWREPQPVRSWTGVRDAASFGAPCAQNSGNRPMANSQEDCLFLNVWNSEWPAKAKKPVMVWFHGGGNYGGTASSAASDGESLARHGVVLVTVNYRLNIFGFFAHPELTKESPHHASGNYGLMDQVAALKWVHDNIAKFGGDPANVTIFGQSAGAVDVNVLMTSPLARGLFQRVIAESGTVTRNPDEATLGLTALGALMKVKSGPVSYSDAPTLAEAERTGEQLTGGKNLKDLRALPAEELLKFVAGPRLSIGPANGVVADGWVFPKPPAQVFASGQEQKVPLLVGNNSRERTPPGTPADLAKAMEGAMEAMYGPLAPRAFSLYGINGSSAPEPDPLYGGQAAQWVVDTMYRCPVVAELAWHAAAGNPAYEYQFDRAAPGREAAGATHGAEVSYVFGRLGANYAQADRNLSSAMEQYWTNFAKAGDPNGGGLAQWPKFDSTARGFMEFTDNGPVSREGLRRPFCDLYMENVKRLLSQ
jgi:para-nitrobenzyl esterase